MQPPGALDAHALAFCAHLPAAQPHLREGMPRNGQMTLGCGAGGAELDAACHLQLESTT
jgi:hypothetical protein